MKGIYIRENSPYYWLRYYDKYEEDTKKRRKSVSTKIEISNADLRRIGQAKKNNLPLSLQGTAQLRERLRQFRAGLFEKDIKHQSGVKLKKGLKLSDGLKDYLFNKPKLKPKTIQAYEYAVQKMIAAATDKEIYRYHKKDYILLIRYCAEQKFSETSSAIITRHLHPLWNWFVGQKHTNENIIEKLKTPKGNPLPIPPKELREILHYYSKKGIPSQERAAKLLLLTGFRPSTAIVLDWENVDLDNEIIVAMNVKANRPFAFPIHAELKKLLLEIGAKRSGNVLGYKTKESLDFFKRDMKKLFLAKLISHRYSLYNLRDTFASHLANHNLDISNVQELLNHSDSKITRGHYVRMQQKYLKKKIEQAQFSELVRQRDMHEQIDEEVEELESVLHNVLHNVLHKQN